MLNVRFILLLLLATLALPCEADTADRVVVAELLREYQRESGISVADLDTASFDKLMQGQTVNRKISMTLSGASDGDNSITRVVGYRLIDKPREPLWLTALAVDGGFSKRLTEHFVRMHDNGGACWYQHVDMPWPLKDRHWLVRSDKNLSVAQHTDNRLWEHFWRLVPDAKTEIDALYAKGNVSGLTQKQKEKSVMLPLNNGAWVMGLVNPNRTLVMVHATLDMGGIIPDGFVARQSRINLTRTLTKIEQDADSAWARYGDAYRIYRGDGTLIRPQDAKPAQALTTQRSAR
ncbi:MAG: hypothetical protein AAGA84_02385 [Pseudomonadota bacterium]